MIRLALLLAPLLAAGSEPLIRVDSIALTEVAIARRADALRAEGKRFSGEQLVDALVDEALLAAEARRSGLDRVPDIRSMMDQEAARALAEAFANGPLSAGYQPPEAELMELYHRGSDVVQLDLIAVATEAEAQQVKERLLAGGEFAIEATRSLDPRSGANRGSTGPRARGELPPALATAAFEAPIGELFGPVRLAAGFGVARVVKREIADPKGFPARRASLESFARKQWLNAARKHYAEQLRVKAGATVDEKFIQTLGARVDATPAELDHPFASISGEAIPYRVLLPRVRRMGTGHMQGVATKTQLAWTLVDERLLAKAALDAGTATTPEALMDVATAQNQALAAAMAERIRSALPASADARKREDAVVSRIKALRKDFRVQVDRKAAAAAAESRR